MKRFALISLMILSLGLAFGLSCYDVQYTETAGDGTYPSPYAGQTITVTGIVTNNTYGTTSTYPTSTKFFITDPAGGPWSGLYIYVFGSGVMVGDMVECHGPLSEYNGMTELVFATGTTTTTILSSGNALPEPALITTAALTNPANPALGEMWESVLCKVQDVTATSTPDTHQEFYVNDGSGTGQIDDACYLYGHSWSGVSVGTHWDQITGVVDYSYSLYGLNPRDNADLVTTSNEDNVVVLPEAKLIGNFPNPMNASTEIAFNLKSAQTVSIDVYNLKGQKVRTLVNGKLNAQLHNVTFDGRADNGSQLSSGVYLYKMTAGNIVETRKLVIR
jgi:hypothetical protein